MKPEAPDHDGRASPGLIQRLLLPLFLLGAIGTLAELVLLGHYEEIWQLIPLLLLTISLTVVAMWFIAGRPGAVLRVFQFTMLLCLVAGALGIYLHYDSNVEFELEMNPSARGSELVWNSLTGAMPALAPGTMFQIGLVGLLYTYRHPVFRSQSKNAGAPLEKLKKNDEI